MLTSREVRMWQRMRNVMLRQAQARHKRVQTVRAHAKIKMQN